MFIYSTADTKPLYKLVCSSLTGLQHVAALCKATVTAGRTQAKATVTGPEAEGVCDMVTDGARVAAFTLAYMHNLDRR